MDRLQALRSKPIPKAPPQVSISTNVVINRSRAARAEGERAGEEGERYKMDKIKETEREDDDGDGDDEARGVGDDDDGDEAREVGDDDDGDGDDGAAVARPAAPVSIRVGDSVAAAEIASSKLGIDLGENPDDAYKRMMDALRSRGIPVGVEMRSSGIDERARIVAAASTLTDAKPPRQPLRRAPRFPGTAAAAPSAASAAAASSADVVPATAATRRTTTVYRRPKSSINDLVTKYDSTIPGEIIQRVFKNNPPSRRLNAPRIPPLRVPSYYLNNHRRFISAMSSLFAPYRAEIEKEKLTEVSCEGRRREAGADFSLLTHQKIVRDYIQVFTPYRGILLYHGLGSGKTCTSIAIAESFKDNKKIIVMTPASLQESYRQELRKCGDVLFRRNQHWEFLPIAKTDLDGIGAAARVTGLEPDFIKSRGGVWMVDRTKKPNELDEEQNRQLNAQINRMIDAKYHFINYNGITKKSWKKMTTAGGAEGAAVRAIAAAASAASASGAGGDDDNAGAAASKEKEVNPFDNAVVIVDEAHNLMSRIVNKLGRKGAVAAEIYEKMLSAHNSRFVFLSGTPLINYPNEMAIMFNILRGYITMWKMVVRVDTEQRIDEEAIREILKGLGESDYISYKPSSFTLQITRNPFGFSNVMEDGKRYEGITLSSRPQVTDAFFLGAIRSRLRSRGIEIPGKIMVSYYKALPDTLDTFADKFLKSDGKGEIMNPNLLRRRILGLTSYFRSAQEQLLPKYDTTKNPHIMEIEMSDYQLGVHEDERQKERDQERRRKKPVGVNEAAAMYKDTTSTYRIFSRAACNFVFPPDLPRPKKEKGKGKGKNQATTEDIDEDDIDGASIREREENPDARFDDDDAALLGADIESAGARSYAEQLQDTLKRLDENADKYLTPEALSIYSPKFLTILENLLEESNRGLNLIYSQFRTLEGIGVLSLVLKHNGFTQLKVKNIGGEWKLDIPDDDRMAGRPRFALYTGTETSEEREMIRKIFNGEWGALPTSLSAELRRIHPNNRYGEVVKVMMITSSGAEGINLRNVRRVHIVEPYWHPSRIEQVIGRARRICSHEDLPEEDRTVDVFMYHMVYPKSITDPTDPEHKKVKEKFISLFTSPGDKGKISTDKVLTSDGILFEISTVKNNTNQGLLKAVKETSIDCPIYVSGSGDASGLVCFSFDKGYPDQYDYASKPSIDTEEVDAVEAATAIMSERRAMDAAAIVRQPAVRKQIKKTAQSDETTAAEAAAAASSAAAAAAKPATALESAMAVSAAAAAREAAPKRTAVVKHQMKIMKRGAESYAVNLDTGDTYNLEKYQQTPPVFELLPDITKIMKSAAMLPRLQAEAAKIRAAAAAAAASSSASK